MTTQLQELKSLPLFRGLPDVVLESVSDVVIRHHYVPKEYIIFEEKPCHSAYFIQDGRANVFRRSVSGQKLVLARLGRGDCFGVACCLESRSTCPATVRALTPVRALSISKDDLWRLLHRYPELTFAVLNHLANRLKQLTGLVEMLGLLSTRGRVARFILDHADNGGVIYWHCTQEDIASRLGTVQDVVGRALRSFADEGLIEMPTRHCIVVRDSDRLEIEAQR
jgi:CRP/FNR family cyclic AMP-dependent transcriptional regulator